MTEQQYYQDATVYDAGGEKIGTLYAYDPQGGYLTVQKGFLFHTDLYIPENAVQNTDGDGNIHLSLYKDDLQGDRYANAPTSDATVAGDYGQSITAETTTTRAQATAPPTRQATTQGDETIDVPVYEEELFVGKRQEEQGRVHLHKDVVTEQETVTVPLTQEQVIVERVSFTGQMSQADLQTAFQDQDIDVPVMGEEAVVTKQAHVTEEVRLHKDQVTEQEQVTDTVRKERVTVESAGDVDGTDTRRGQRTQTTPRR